MYVSQTALKIIAVVIFICGVALSKYMDGNENMSKDLKNFLKKLITAITILYIAFIVLFID